MTFDLAFFLVLASVVTGLIWALDALLWRPRREQQTVTTGEAAVEPTIVEYARSFFPVIVIVLIVRSFLFEPFRIPSSSMVPTLLVGDFIFVNKFVYGLRLPVINHKVFELGAPERGDVVVFRLPSDPGTNYIKRVVGEPGDRIRYRRKRLMVNGEAVPFDVDGPYRGPGCGISENLVQPGARIAREQLSGIEHEVLLMPGRSGKEGEWTVPEGHYFLMGDNRDNSKDSRYADVDFVPEDKLVGKAVRIWMNWDWGRTPPIWCRIGDRIL